MYFKFDELISKLNFFFIKAVEIGQHRINSDFTKHQSMLM